MDRDITNQAGSVKVTALSPFTHPLQGQLQGETVRITHLGDAEGMSPVYFVIDSRGNGAWVETGAVKITDSGLVQSESLSSSQASRETSSPTAIGRS